jgi:transcriptional regulator with XRE-family HTH domain
MTTVNENTQQSVFDTAYGSRMRQARERAGLSQEQLAANLVLMHDVNWHQTTVRRTESGERPIRLSEAIAVADLLGVPLSELAHGAADDTPRTERVALAYAALADVRQDIDRRLTRLRGEMTSSEGSGA